MESAGEIDRAALFFREAWSPTDRIGTDVFADAGYQGVGNREENRDTQVNWHIAMRPGKRKSLPETSWGKMLEKVEKIKASIRAKVEHPFHIIKNRLGLRKVRYCGLAKNTAHLYTLLGLANLFINKRRLDALSGVGAS